MNTFRNPRNLAFSWRATLSPTFTNELVVGQSNFGYDFVNNLADPNAVWFPLAPTAPVDTVASAYASGNARTLNTIQVVDNASWVRGSHLIKFGINLRYISHNDNRGSIASDNAYQGVDFSTSVNPVDPGLFNLPGNIERTNDLANLQSSVNFLLGRVGRTARGFASDGVAYVPGNYRFKANYKQFGYFLQDTFKVNRKLTVDVGVRLEQFLSPTESSGRIRRPDQPLVYGAAPTNTANWVQGSLFPSITNAWAPSIGFAYDPFGTGKTAIRANYRMAYDPLNTFVLSNAIFQNIPGSTLAVSNQTFGASGDGRLSNLPAIGAPTGDPNAATQPAPFGTNNITTVDPNLKLPTTQMWSFGIQREIAHNTVFSVDYTGRRAYHLFGAYDANQVDVNRTGFVNAISIASAGGQSALLDQITTGDTRRRTGETGAAFIRRLFPSQLALGSVANIAGSLATQAPGASIFRRFGQFGQANVVDSNDFSTYHGVVFQILRKLTRGLEVQFSYTYQKSLDTRSYDPAFTVVGTGVNQSASSTPFDITNRRLNYGRSDFDRRHVFNSYWVAELPFGKGKLVGTNAGPWLDRLIGGWQVTGNFYYYSGRPFTVYSGSFTNSNVVSSPANCANCSQDLGSLFTDPGSGFAFYFDQSQRSQFSVPAAGAALGNTARNFFQSQGWFRMNASLSKRIRVTETTNLELRADASNLTNTPQWDNPTASLQSATFGRLYTPLSGQSRKIQLGVKVNF